MGILMLETAARDEIARVDQRLDDGFVGIALFALVGDDAFSGKTRRIFGVKAIGIDGVGDFGFNAAL